MFIGYSETIKKREFYETGDREIIVGSCVPPKMEGSEIISIVERLVFWGGER